MLLIMLRLVQVDGDEYENFPTICFHCGRVGHRIDGCATAPKRQVVEKSHSSIDQHLQAGIRDGE